MSACAKELRALVAQVEPQLTTWSEAVVRSRPGPGKWSPCELVGHLIDSASNNHQRFVRARFVEHLEFPGYDQDQWVAAQAYQDSDWPALVGLWARYNLHLAHVIESTPEATRALERRRHNLDEIAFRTVPRAQVVTLEYFMCDYVDHLRHHLAWLAGHTDLSL